MDVEIIIHPHGLIEFIHDDAVFEALRELGGSSMTQRAGRVEPVFLSDKWDATLIPEFLMTHIRGDNVNTPRFLGRFATRHEALAAEHEAVQAILESIGDDRLVHALPFMRPTL